MPPENIPSRESAARLFLGVKWQRAARVKVAARPTGLLIVTRWESAGHRRVGLLRARSVPVRHRLATAQRNIGLFAHSDTARGIVAIRRTVRCPLWVISGQIISRQNPPLSAVVQKWTNAGAIGLSAKCQ
jgi:hypothetical protein